MNKQIILAQRPEGLPIESDFNLVESPIPTPAAGEILVQTLYLSVDPYMRGRMNDMKSYAPPVKLGEVMPGGVVGQVAVQSHPVSKWGHCRRVFRLARVCSVRRQRRAKN